MLPVKARARRAGVKARDVKGILPLMVLMVIVFLLLLFWENELNEDVVLTSIEHLHVDYPQNAAPLRYCNHMILQRVIRESDHTCKRTHVFIHERPQKINSICTSSKKMACPNYSDIFCFQSETRFRMTVCQLIEGVKYPACRYQISPREGFVLVTCDDLGPVNFQGYVD
ncbi:probable inactive ribonuclease-like protein 12 isoform X1 [Meriones unguiculatus]|uniref:probable inactive ribonuclease-like protein 12 isoform X1 n=2 Tax=Meriones unguiculatus TaxID=10047 RepID=UPI000B4FC5B4|nr:probable inactive ribonuclease-like protein 12 isoform X1 [Meriones unguiculatus]